MTDDLAPVRIIWHSTDGGRTWEPEVLRPRSLLTVVKFDEDGLWDDGLGNLYRQEAPA